MANGVLKDVRKEIVGIIFEALTPDINPSRVFSQNEETKEVNNDGTPWARISVKHVSGGLTSIGGIGARRIEKIGMVTTQIFVPANSKNKLTEADRIADLAVDALEIKETPISGIEFTNVVATEIGQDGVWFLYNVTAQFNYQTVK